MKNHPINLRNIRITDEFWREKIELVRKEVIPYQWEALNDRIAADPALGDGYVIGHSYFCANGADAEEIVKFDLAPTLKEYWFDDTGKAEGEIKTLLESAK